MPTPDPAPFPTSPTLAIIPARGGSKGLPRKNVLPLAGRPLLAWTIQAALQARRIDRVVVSTDDPEIMDVARRHGAEVVPRPAELSGDRASSESALLHAIEHLRKTEGYEPATVALLQCTSPLTAPEDIDGTVAALDPTDAAAPPADSAVAVTPFHYFLWREGPAGEAVGVNHDATAPRLLRQQRTPEYLETGAVYAMRREGFEASGQRFFGRVAMHVTPAHRRLEIDEPVDFVLARTLLDLAGRDAAIDRLPPRVQGLVLDFDGVFTDNRVLVDQDGRETAACSRGDGMGLAQLRKTGLPIVVITKERVPIAEHRCAKLKLPCQAGVDDKATAVRDWAQQQGAALDAVVYLGNDLNDVPAMRDVGCPVAVADAHAPARDAPRLVLTRQGGDGAVRELCDLILARHGLDPNAP